jgi:hypothetical protein
MQPAVRAHCSGLSRSQAKEPRCFGPSAPGHKLNGRNFVTGDTPRDANSVEDAFTVEPLGLRQRRVDLVRATT